MHKCGFATAPAIMLATWQSVSACDAKVWSKTHICQYIIADELFKLDQMWTYSFGIGIMDSGRDNETHARFSHFAKLRFGNALLEDQMMFRPNAVSFIYNLTPSVLPCCFRGKLAQSIRWKYYVLIGCNALEQRSLDACSPR